MNSEINLVVLELRQFIDEERADGIALNAVVAADMFGDLRGQRACAFQFGGERVDQQSVVWHGVVRQPATDRGAGHQATPCYLCRR